MRRAIASLLKKKLIRREKLFARHQQQEYRSFWWQPRNQTYYYSINYEELEKLIETTEARPAHGEPSSPSFLAQTIENVRFEKSTKLSIEENKETKVCELSRNSTKNTNHKKLTNKQDYSDRFSRKSEQFAAASPKQTVEEEINQKGSKPHSVELPVSPGQKKVKSEAASSNTGKEINDGIVDYIVNKDWKDLIPLLDSTGIPINKTIKDLLKLYSKEKVESAIALLKARKREQHIPNPSGYFVSALKGDWAEQNLVEKEGDRCQSSEIDKAAVFRHWYDLARELGYCSGQQVRERGNSGSIYREVGSNGRQQ